MWYLYAEVQQEKLAKLRASLQAEASLEPDSVPMDIVPGQVSGAIDVWKTSTNQSIFSFKIQRLFVCTGAPIVAHSTGEYAAGTNSAPVPPCATTPQSSCGKGKGGLDTLSLKRTWTSTMLDTTTHDDEAKEVPPPKRTVPSPPESLQVVEPHEWTDAQPRSLPSFSPICHKPTEEDLEANQTTSPAAPAQPAEKPAVSSGLPVNDKKEEKDALYWKFFSCKVFSANMRGHLKYMGDDVEAPSCREASSHICTKTVIWCVDPRLRRRIQKKNTSEAAVSLWKSKDGSIWLAFVHRNFIDLIQI